MECPGCWPGYRYGEAHSGHPDDGPLEPSGVTHVCSFCWSTDMIELILDIRDRKVRRMSCGDCRESIWLVDGEISAIEDAVKVFRSRRLSDNDRPPEAA